MLKSRVNIQLPRGLQARNTARFVEIASFFYSDITIIKEGIPCQIDATNIMGIMDLNVEEGQEITLIANGIDEINSIKVLKKFLMGHLNNTQQESAPIICEGPVGGSLKSNQCL